MASAIKLAKNPTLLPATIHLPSSKSESNRALIINAFAGGELKNLSAARDTQTMISLLRSDAKILDVIDAGTTMRFLVAYYALTDQNKILIGTPRMCDRPIGILVDALREIGAEIDYSGKDGFPPIETKGFEQQKSDSISIRGDVSSQYVSAILMVAPILPKGLTIRLTGKIASRPYIEMTLELMRSFGAKAQFSSRDTIQVFPSSYRATTYAIESDWSGASYWFSMVALAEKGTITLTGLKQQSLQGDSCITEIMHPLGVKAVFSDEGLVLRKIDQVISFSYDFSNCPDLAQTIAVVCAAKGIHATFTGLESLKIKETDRITALQNELEKIHASLKVEGEKTWKLIPSPSISAAKAISVETYDDHRMAMAFAPLATKMNLEIQHPMVVAKSYPSFWTDMQQVGFRIEEI